MNPQTFIFIGRSGCGKGTQAELLVNKLKEKGRKDVLYLSTGQKFREFIEGSSYAAKLSKEIYDAGGIQPEFLAVWNWSSIFIENVKENTDLVVDGMPRKLDEARIFESTFSFYKRENPIVVFINVSENWATERLQKRARLDDNTDDIKARMRWFESDVMSVIDFFKENGRFNLIEINGEQEIEKVHADIVKAVFN